MIDEISNIIKPTIQNTIQKILENNPILKNSDEIKQVVSWVKEATGDSNINASDTIMSLVKGTASYALLSCDGNDDTISHSAISYSPYIQNVNNITPSSSVAGIDSVYSKIASIIAERLSGELAVPFAQATFENIKIRTQGEEKQATFDVSFVMDSIKPYVAYIKKVNRAPVLQLKTVFQIDSDVTLSNVGLTTKEEVGPDQGITKGQAIGLDTMTAHGSISILKLSSNTMPIVNTLVNKSNDGEPRKLKEFEFEADLSKISMYM